MEDDIMSVNRGREEDPQDKVNFFAWVLRREFEDVILYEGGKVYTANGDKLYKKYLEWRAR